IFSAACKNPHGLRLLAIPMYKNRELTGNRSVMQLCGGGIAGAEVARERRSRRREAEGDRGQNQVRCKRIAEKGNSHGVALQEASPAMGIHGPEDPDGEVTDQKERYGGGQSRAHHAYWGGPAHNELPHKECSRVPGADYEEVPRLGDSVVNPCEIDIGGGEHQHWD